MKLNLKQKHQAKVSVITPCYNGEKYVARFLDSLLNQTYKNLEIIFVNDGSTDDTENIVLKYKTMFEKKGNDFIYINKENGGAASAINIGIKHFTGEYMVWPDSDDEYFPFAIEEMVSYLENNKEYGFVRSEISVNDFDTKEKLFSYKTKYDDPHYDIFEDLIIWNDIWPCPIQYMVRSEAWLETNPLREIYVSPYGQNYQMLLPIAFKYKCGYVDKELSIYYIRSDSHSRSHSMGNFEKEINKQNGIVANIIETLKTLTLLDEYECLVDQIFIPYKLKICLDYEKWDEVVKYGDYIKKNKGLYNKYMYVACKNKILRPIMFFILKCYRFVKSKLKK